MNLCTVNHARLYACAPCPVCGVRDARRTVLHPAPGEAPPPPGYIPRFARVDALDPEADIPQ